ncbi:MAG: lipopolysaccharide kinase InaA family protein, partial [Gammaproteobacteria bacterium]
DASLQQADRKYLKQGYSCTLWRAHADGHELVVKRYNIKRFSHRIGRSLRPTRAAVSWKNAHRLEMCAIPTPKPVALVEERFGPLRGRAWYVCEYVPGDDALVLCDPPMDKSNTAQAVASIVSVLKQLADCRISHGDMKGNNFILTSPGATLIDLDAMKQHKRLPAFQRAQRRDLRRFMRNWETCPETAAMFHQQLREHGLVTGE